MDSRATVVIMTRNRSAELARSLEMTGRLEPRPPVIVVDNGSTDDTSARVACDFGWARLITLPDNRGSTARNVGVVEATTPYIAFCDDDSWWADDALPRAVDALDRQPQLALVAGTVLVGPEQRVDDFSRTLAASRLGVRPGLPGPSVLGFQACAAVVRRSAFLQVGGFKPVAEFPGEEEILSYDLAAAGWAQCYLSDVVAHHHPSPVRGTSSRRIAAERNAVLTAVARRPAPVAMTALLRTTRHPKVAAAVLGRLPGALRQRRPLPREVERMVRTLEKGG